MVKCRFKLVTSKYFRVLNLSALLILSISLIGYCSLEEMIAESQLQFLDGTLSGWTVEGENIWQVKASIDDETKFMVTSLAFGEEKTGTLRSAPFVIEKEIQKFSLTGADGTAENTNDGNLNFMLLRSWPDGEILRRHRLSGNVQNWNDRRTDMYHVNWLEDGESHKV